MAIHTFITRVQLQGAQPTDLEKLDIEMERESFKKVNGSYNLHGNISLLDVNGAVSRAANRTGKKYSFTVIRDKKLSLL